LSVDIKSNLDSALFLFNDNAGLLAAFLNIAESPHSFVAEYKNKSDDLIRTLVVSGYISDIVAPLEAGGERMTIILTDKGLKVYEIIISDDRTPLAKLIPLRCLE